MEFHITEELEQLLEGSRIGILAYYSLSNAYLFYKITY